MVVGHVDRLPTYIRAGHARRLLLRPLPVLAQLITSDLSLRRLGAAVASALVALVVGADAATTSRGRRPRSLLIVLTRRQRHRHLRGAVRRAPAACSSSSSTAPELTNAFTYGGSYAASQPSRRSSPTRCSILFGLRRPDRLHRVPAGAGDPRPARATAAARLAGLVHAARRAAGVWRRRRCCCGGSGTRHYQGAGG